MKRNDITALHSMTAEELNTKLEVLQRELAEARLQKAVGKLANTASIKNISDDIARIKTVQGNQELQAKK